MADNEISLRSICANECVPEAGVQRVLRRIRDEVLNDHIVITHSLGTFYLRKAAASTRTLRGVQYTVPAKECIALRGACRGVDGGDALRVEIPFRWQWNNAEFLGVGDIGSPFQNPYTSDTFNSFFQDIPSAEITGFVLTPLQSEYLAGTPIDTRVSWSVVPREAGGFVYTGFRVRDTVRNVVLAEGSGTNVTVDWVLPLDGAFQLAFTAMFEHPTLRPEFRRRFIPLSFTNRATTGF